MFSYCLKCGKNTSSKNPKVARTKNGNFIKMCSAIIKKWHLSKSKKLADYKVAFASLR